MIETAERLEQEQRVYRVQGFTCANCAGTFENNVKRLPGVRDAKVNFGASKITVYGETTVAELEKAGAFEQLKIFPDPPVRGESGEHAASRGWEALAGLRQLAMTGAVLLLVLGYVSRFANGEAHPLTSLLLAASIFTGGYSLFLGGFRNLLRFEFDMRTLMTVAVIGAAIIGEWAEGAVVVILFAISETLERYAMDRARSSIRSLMDIAPSEALVRRNGKEQLVRVGRIVVGDVIIVGPGRKIAMDGVVVGGHSTVNQAAITGESIPVAKSVGDEVFAGTLNEEGLLEVKVTKPAEDTTIAKIIHLVEEAQAERAPSQAWVDKFAKVYTPAIIVIAALVAVVPPLFIGGDWGSWIYQGLAVLVVGCPCALVVSTPISVVSAIGNAARHGVLIKGGIHLEQLGTLNAVAFDKTGTLTSGVPAATDFKVFDPSADAGRLLSEVAALELRSGHPLAAAVVGLAQRQNVAFSDVEVDDVVAMTGKGIKGNVNGTTYVIGSPKLFDEWPGCRLNDEQEALIRSMQHAGKSVMVVGSGNDVIAAVAVADEVRASGREAVQGLHRIGVKHTVMLTGDNKSTAEAIAARVGVSETRAELMPQDKLEAIGQLKRDFGNVAMVGDGVNDAPALAASTVGIAMGGAGTDTALETADVALMGDDLRKLPFTIELSRKTLAIIKQNITFALAVKLLALLLVVPGWLTLWIAILSDLGATILVALNSMRLMGVGPRRSNADS